jgi:glycosyltransferase involved in cell wall biosynthesis
MNCTVAICTRNQIADLRETLESVGGQVVNATWDVIVVDNGSVDGTTEWVRRRAVDYPVPMHLSVEGRHGLSHARNRAIREARGEVILFIDDDVTCAPNWLQGHLDAYKDPEVIGTGGRIIPRFPADTPEWLRAELASKNGGPASRYDYGDSPAEVGGVDGLPAPLGANMGVRLALAKSIGFRADLGWGKRMVPGEESAFFEALITAGHKVVYCPEARLEHRLRASRMNMRYFLRWWRGCGRAAILRGERLTPSERAKASLGEGYRALRFACKTLRYAQTSGQGLKVRKKREMAIGRVLELLGF